MDAYVYRWVGNEVLYLLLKRAKTKIYEHLWQGIAGKIEAGETAPEAAIRELKEETGLHPVKMFVADHVSRFYEVYGDRINLVPVFGIKVDSEQVTLSSEHSAHSWVTLDEAIDTLIWKGQKSGIQTVHEMIMKNDDRMRWSEVEL